MMNVPRISEDRLVQTRQIIGFAGVGALVVGCFVPLIQYPFGSINYIANGQGDGIFLLILGAIAAYLVFTESYRYLWVPTILAVALCTFTFINISSGLMEVGSSMEKELAGNPFRGIADVMLASVRFGWGWIPLLIGLGCLLVTSFMPISGTVTPQSVEAEHQEEEPAWVTKALDKIERHSGQSLPRSPRLDNHQPSRPSFGKRMRG